MPGVLPTDLPLRLFRNDLFRSHRATRECLHFGKTAEHRFDCPEKSFGVCYTGVDSFCCFAETFRKQIPSRSLLKQRAVSRITTPAPLRLVDLRAIDTRRILGMPNEISSIHDRAGTQAWARALHLHPQQPDGILYPADHDITRDSVALFDRTKLRLVPAHVATWFEHPDLAAILDQYIGLTLDDLPD